MYGLDEQSVLLVCLLMRGTSCWWIQILKMGPMVDKMVYSELQADSRLVSDALAALTELYVGAETPPTWKQEPRRPTEVLFLELHILSVVLFLEGHILSVVLFLEGHSCSVVLFQERHILFGVLFLVDHSLSEVLSPERHSPLEAPC